MIRNERLAAAEGLIQAGEKAAGLRLLSEYLRAEGAVGLSGAVERAGRGNVGGFSLDDIQAIANLDDKQATDVMEDLADNFDAELGMTWEQINDTIDELFPGARTSLEK